MWQLTNTIFKYRVNSIICPDCTLLFNLTMLCLQFHCFITTYLLFFISVPHHLMTQFQVVVSDLFFKIMWLKIVWCFVIFSQSLNPILYQLVKLIGSLSDYTLFTAVYRLWYINKHYSVTYPYSSGSTSHIDLTLIWNQTYNGLLLLILRPKI